jgi:hypothetical protein
MNNVRSILMVALIVGCGPHSENGSAEGGSSSLSTTDSPDDTTPTEPIDDPTPCTFCEEIEMICLSETTIDPWLCARMRKWTCIAHSADACDDMVALCNSKQPPCDAAKVQLLCDAAHDACIIETPPDDSTTGAQGSGEGGGERGDDASTTGSTSIGDTSTGSTGSSTGDERTTIEA